MRDVKRLDSLYKTLHDVHAENFPDWRFGQFMSNFLGWCLGSAHKCDDIFFPEDGKWELWVKEYAESLKR